MDVVAVGSDRSGELIERGSDPEVVVDRIDAEFVVPPSKVLHKRVTSDHHARRAVALLIALTEVPQVCSLKFPTCEAWST